VGLTLLMLPLSELHGSNSIICIILYDPCLANQIVPSLTLLKFPLFFPLFGLSLEQLITLHSLWIFNCINMISGMCRAGKQMNFGIKKIQYLVTVSTCHYGVANIWPQAGQASRRTLELKLFNIYSLWYYYNYSSFIAWICDRINTDCIYIKFILENFTYFITTFCAVKKDLVKFTAHSE